MPSSPPIAELATLACAPCRRQKRRCDKVQPSCSLCTRIGRNCDYSALTSNGDKEGEGRTRDGTEGLVRVEDLEGLREQIRALESLVKSRDVIVSETTNGDVHMGGERMALIDDTSAAYTNGSNDTTLTPLTGSSTLQSSAHSWSPSAQAYTASPFPSLFFLDSFMFTYERFTIAPPHITLPQSTLQALGSSAQLREMIEHYFRTIHLHFPIVSHIRLYQHIANPLHEPGADMALLFLAMKLAMLPVAEGYSARNERLYGEVKGLHAFVESQNGFSVQLLQSALLIALYEIGHGIYPAAYMTVGHCARLGHAMGLHTRDAPEMLARPATWTEQEERRRVWWSVIILDRFINIGHSGKPFATGEPDVNTHVPGNDAGWDKGRMFVAAPLALSASLTTVASPFARTCQASHLLGKVLRHLGDKGMSLEHRFDEALQLSRTLNSLEHALRSEAIKEDMTQYEQPPLCTALSITYSAMLTLFDAYSCTDRAVPNAPETQLQMQQESIEGMFRVSDLAMQLARNLRDHLNSTDVSVCSPLAVDSLYQTAATYAWYMRESSDANTAHLLAELKEILRLVNRRWRVAGEYLTFVEATEFQNAGAIR
ncbi:hypothetical protein LTR95_004361 [Oleoguttula sp. CCFEE 5521]